MSHFEISKFKLIHQTELIRNIKLEIFLLNIPRYTSSNLSHTRTLKFSNLFTFEQSLHRRPTRSRQFRTNSFCLAISAGTTNSRIRFSSVNAASLQRQTASQTDRRIDRENKREGEKKKKGKKFRRE